MGGRISGKHGWKGSQTLACSACGTPRPQTSCDFPPSGTVPPAGQGFPGGGTPPCSCLKSPPTPGQVSPPAGPPRAGGKGSRTAEDGLSALALGAGPGLQGPWRARALSPSQPGSGNARPAPPTRPLCFASSAPGPPRPPPAPCPAPPCFPPRRNRHDSPSGRAGGGGCRATGPSTSGLWQVAKDPQRRHW